MITFVQLLIFFSITNLVSFSQCKVFDFSSNVVERQSEKLSFSVRELTFLYYCTSILTLWFQSNVMDVQTGILTLKVRGLIGHTLTCLLVIGFLKSKLLDIFVIAKFINFIFIHPFFTSMIDSDITLEKLSGTKTLCL